MKNLFIASIFICLGIVSFPQTDSTDITLTVNPPVLLTEMDSILFGGPNFNSYQADFSISDTTNTSEVLIEFSAQGQTLNRLSKTVTDLQNEGLIDSLWNVSINFGNFETGSLYKLTLVIKNYAGIASAPITKQF